MSAPTKGNKENFRLLDLSSDEESDDLQLEIIPSRKKKITRRERNRAGGPQQLEPNIGAEVRCALRWAVRGTLLLWLLMLTWICAALYDQVSTMRLDVIKVSTSSNSVGDALQVCHAAAKELRANATELGSRLTVLERNHTELASRVKQATEELAAVTGQLSAAPKLADTPRRLAELQRMVADFGSQINGFDGALSSARKQAVTAVSGVEEIRTLLHQLEATTNDTIANVSANVKRNEAMKNDITTLNNTMAAQVTALQTRIQEINKSVSTAAPTASAPTSSSTATPSTTTSSTTTTQPPEVPVKPSVLQ